MRKVDKGEKKWWERIGEEGGTDKTWGKEDKIMTEIVPTTLLQVVRLKVTNYNAAACTFILS